MKRHLKVLWFGTWRTEYSRNRIMMEGLRRNNVEIMECHADLWGVIEDRVKLAAGGWRKFSFLLKFMGAWLRLLRGFFRFRDWDVMMLGYPGQFDAYLAFFLARLSRKPLVLDAFMSPYLIALERGLVKKSPFTGKMIHALEKGALKLPDMVIQDTEEYAVWMSKEFGVPRRIVRLVPTGADSTRFFPRHAEKKEGSPFMVVYSGSFIPNHGVSTMIRAAELLKNDHSIAFLFIGEGPDRDETVAYAEKHGLSNVTFKGWMSVDRLAATVSEADLCLGAFGTTPQSLMTVQNKIYESLALGKPLISGDGPAVRAALEHAREICLCPRQDPSALAEAISKLKDDPKLRETLARHGRERFLKTGTVETVGAALKKHLEETVSSRSLK